MKSLLILLSVVVLAACSETGSDVLAAPRLGPGTPTQAWPPVGWAWGVIRAQKDTTQRYGVSGPPAVSRGDVVIMPSYGESAEWWFETARGLNEAGYTVWILDGAGQGGSGRFDARRDLGRMKRYDADVVGLQALIEVVIRPQRPVTVLASGTAALPALAALQRSTPMERLIVSAPSEPSYTLSTPSRIAAAFGLDAMRAPGSQPWRRPLVFQTPRKKSAAGWAIANPDLRMGGPSIEWLLARQKLVDAVQVQTRQVHVRTPIVLIEPQASSFPCLQLPSCRQVRIGARLPYHLEEDRSYEAWRSTVVQLLGTDHAL